MHTKNATSCGHNTVVGCLRGLNCIKKMEGKIKYGYSTKIWKHNAPGGWYFVSLPKKLSKEIRQNLKWQEEGWGRMKAFAQIGESKWETAIWFDTKKGAYILPIKAEIRKKANLKIDQNIEMNIWV